MELTISSLRALVKRALKDEPTGDAFLDRAYDEYTQSVGHSNPYYRLIYLLAQRVQPKTYVELGVDAGLAISHAAAGSSSCRCIGIDPWCDPDNRFRQAKEKADHYSNIELVRGWSIPECAEEWLRVHKGLSSKQITHHRLISDMPSAVPEQIDMLFIDAWHEARFTKKEWAIYGARVPHNGIALFDDVGGWYQEMTGFWTEAKEGLRSIETSSLHPGILFGVVLK